VILDQYSRPINTASLAAARRIADRAARRDSLNASYDAAANTQENAKHWRWADNLSATSANSATVRKTLRQRSRYECLENNSFAKGIALTLANDTIATGPCLQVNLPDASASRMIEQRWRKWARDVRLASKLRTARLSKIIDGETILLKGTNRRSANAVQLDMRLIEADMLATPNFADGMPNQVDGIVFDDFGNPTEYHVLKGHPGDIFPMKAWEVETISPDDLIHIFRVERPGQQRGIPELTPALPLFAQLRRYTLAVITAAENAADFSAILKTQSNAFDSSTDGVDDVEPFDFVQIDRGMMVSLPRGWDMTQFKPEQPTTTYEGFRNAILNEIARCVHMPSNKARADSSQYNYSSGRLDHQTYYEAIAVERSQWEIECLDRIFSWWLDEALMLDGYLPALEPMDEIPHQWRWPPNRDVNPSEIAEANIKLIDAGLKTRQQYLIEQNIDPEEHQTQLAHECWINPVTQVAATMPNATNETPSPSPGPTSPTVGTEATAASDETTPPPAGEFANISRQQLNRNLKAIDDAITKLESGEWSISRARVFLSSIGLTDRTIDNLLSEYVGT
jgi:lambda family phage portal protein